MSYSVNYGNGVVNLPAEALELCGDILQLKLLMLLSYDRAMCEADDTVIAERLDCTLDRLSEAVSELRVLKLIEPEKKSAPSVKGKNLDGEEISALLDGDSGFAELINECQSICGRIFTPTDISKIVSLRKELGLDKEMILLIFFYYSEKLDSVGKKLTVSYAEKSAYSLYNQGVRTVDGLEEYIKKTEEKNSLSCKLRRLFGIGERALTKKEKKFFDTWCTEWGMPYELIELSYDITVDSTGKIALEYMSKILSDWHDSGITTLEGAEANLEQFKSRSKQRKERKFKEDAAEGGSSFNTEEFFAKALERSYAMMGLGDNK